MNCLNFLDQEGIDQTVEEWEAQWGNPDEEPRKKGKGIMPCMGCIDKPNLRPHRCCFKGAGGLKPKTDKASVQADIMRLVKEGLVEAITMAIKSTNGGKKWGNSLIILPVQST